MEDPLGRIARVTRLPRPENRHAQLTSPAAGETCVYRPLDDRGWVVWLHWAGTKSVFCLDPSSDCPQCQAEQPGRLFRAGYLPVLCEKGWVVRVLYLTDNALSCCPQLLGSMIEGGLKGRVIRARRAGKGARGKMFADLEAAEKAINWKGEVVDMQKWMAVLFNSQAVRLQRRRQETEV